LIQPLHDRVLVERLPVEHSSGIVLPENAEPEESARQAVWTKIIAVGPGKWHEGDEHESGWLEPTVVKPGQIAIIGPYTDLEVGKQVLVQEADIRCIVG
jgi:co-chaperonin GroES (HSP10)